MTNHDNESRQVSATNGQDGNQTTANEPKLRVLFITPSFLVIVNPVATLRCCARLSHCVNVALKSRSSICTAFPC